MKPEISAVIVCFNGEKWLPEVLKSLKNQTSPPAQVILVDNGSTDRTCEIFLSQFPEGILLKNPNNLGFATGANQGLNACSHSYGLLLNQDVVLSSWYVENLFAILSCQKDCVGVSGLLLKPDGSVDSAGHQAYTDRVLIDRKSFSGEVEEVFSIPATAALFSLPHLRKLALPEGEIFDPLFFSYLEDVDLGFRAQFAGLSCFFVPEAVAIHFRESSGLRQSFPLQWKAHKNYPLLLLKYETFSSFLLDAPEILFFLLYRFFRTLFTHPLLLFSDAQIVPLWKTILKRRKHLKSIQQRTWREIRKKMLRGRLWRRIFQ